MKLNIKSNKGMSLSTIVISIILMIIILSSIVLSVNKTSEAKEAMQLNNDIEELTRRVKLYYMQNGTLPIDERYSEYIVFEESDLEEEFYLLNISAFDNLNLKNKEDITIHDDGSINVRKGYLINKETHLIYYMEWDREVDRLLPVKYKYSEGYEEFLKRAKIEMKQVEEVPEKVESGEILKFNIYNNLKSDGTFYFKEYGDVQLAEVTGLTDYGNLIEGLELVIPKYYNGKIVANIAASAFYEAEKIKSVVAPDTLIKIGNSAFSKSSIENVDANSVIYIDNFAFYFCNKLNKINVPNTEEVGIRVFTDCRELTYIDLSKINHITDRMFQNCYKLEKVELDFTKEFKIDVKAFYGCSKLELDFTTLKLNQTDIFESTFYGCNKINGTLDLSNIKKVGSLAFYSCGQLDFKADNPTSSIEEQYKLSNITTLEPGAFKTSGISGTIYLKSIETIPSAAFNNCKNLDKVILESVTKIDDAAYDAEGKKDTGAFAVTNITSLIIQKPNN